MIPLIQENWFVDRNLVTMGNSMPPRDPKDDDDDDDDDDEDEDDEADEPAIIREPDEEG
jgi:hypothetical protein